MTNSKMLQRGGWEGMPAFAPMRPRQVVLRHPSRVGTKFFRTPGVESRYRKLRERNHILELSEKIGKMRQALEKKEPNIEKPDTILDLMNALAHLDGLHFWQRAEFVQAARKIMVLQAADIILWLRTQRPNERSRGRLDEQVLQLALRLGTPTPQQLAGRVLAAGENGWRLERLGREGRSPLRRQVIQLLEGLGETGRAERLREHLDERRRQDRQWWKKTDKDIRRAAEEWGAQHQNGNGAAGSAQNGNGRQVWH